jgi:hypothetical protein
MVLQIHLGRRDDDRYGERSLAEPSRLNHELVPVGEGRKEWASISRVIGNILASANNAERRLGMSVGFLPVCASSPMAT